MGTTGLACTQPETPSGNPTENTHRSKQKTSQTLRENGRAPSQKNATQQLEGGQHNPTPKQAGDKPLARRLLQSDAALAKQTDESRRAARPLNSKSTPKGTRPGHPCSRSNCKSRQYPPDQTTYAPQPTKHRRKQPTQSGRRPASTEKTDNNAQQTFRHHQPAIRATQDQQPRNQTAQRYGKGRAANESETKPRNLDKNET